jgi:hypothetical protein
VEHVPTTLFEKDNRLYARIKSITNSKYSVISNNKEFEDMENHWAKESVNKFGSKIIVQGKDEKNFGPTDYIRRAELATIIVKAMGLKENNYLKSFKDISSSEWYAGTVETAYQFGFMIGYNEDHTFRPNSFITREEAIVALTRGIILAGIPINIQISDNYKILDKFKDKEQISEWSKNYISVLVKMGIVNGYEGKIMPRKFITRAESVQIIQKLLKKVFLIE